MNHNLLSPLKPQTQTADLGTAGGITHNLQPPLRGKIGPHTVAFWGNIKSCYSVLYRLQLNHHWFLFLFVLTLNKKKTLNVRWYC